ncbi:MAG: amidase [Acidimicrobiales bacterium]
MITNDHYLSLDAVAMADLVRSGEVSADELAEACLARTDEVDPHINAVADRAGDAPAHDPDTDAPFPGVPFAVKELLAVPGLPWTMGSRLMAGNPAPPPSPYVERLLGSGLNIVCSTTSSELGLLGSTESFLRGTTINPWGEGLSAGGSSGGSAAAVAAGIVPMAHANDAGGSIRGPAALAGLFGFMPSRGRCEPAAPDTGLAALVLDHCISRTVRDSAALLAVTERHGPDATHQPIGWVRDPADEPLRVGVITHTLLGAAPEPAVKAALDRTIALLEELGHRIVDTPTPPIDGAALSHAFFSTAARTVADMVEMVTPMLGRAPGPDELEPFTLELAEWAATLPDDVEASAQRVFANASAAYRWLFERCDVVLSPTFARLPYPLGTLHPDLGREELIRRTEEIVGYTPIHNVAGCPAMSVPLEWHDGLPVGMHLAAAPGDDARLLGLAYQLEAARPWAYRRPTIATATAS